jgi:hypothetical protein
MRVDLRYAIVLLLLACAQPVLAAEKFEDAVAVPEEPAVPLETPVSDAAQTDQQRRFVVSVGAVILQRDSPAERTLVTQGGNEFLNADELDFSVGAGPDVYTWRRGEMFDFDFRFFSASNMSVLRDFTPSGPLQIDVGLPITVNSPFLDASYRSDILSFEWNFRKYVRPRFTPLAGLRLMLLSDVLDYTYDNQADGLDDITTSVFAANALFGGQLGFDAKLVTTDRFRLQTALKTGIYANAASNLLRFRTHGEFDMSTGTDAGETSFVCDYSLTSVLQLSERWAARFGYQLLYLTGLALASEQSRIGPGPVHVVTTGDLLLQGALVSLEAGW